MPDSFASLREEDKQFVRNYLRNNTMGQLDLKSIKYSDLMSLQKLLTPKMNKYIPHAPTPKQAAFLLLPNKEAFYGGAAGGGKAFKLDTPILTNIGWKTIGALNLEDRVLAGDGTWTDLEYITEIQQNHACYLITFNSGESIVADTEHLWPIDTFVGRKYWKSSIKTTNQLKMNDKLIVRQSMLGESVHLDIDPYIFGYWLGDGNARTGSITCHDKDLKSLQQYCTLSPYDSMSMQYTIEGLTTQLHTLGVLRNKHDNRISAPETKHIPVKFLLSSFEQRLSLLQGIMDSDGSVQDRGRCELGLKEKRLFDDVCSLLASLGIVFSSTIAPTTYLGEAFPSYRCTFSTTLPVFRLVRKKSKLPTKTCSNRIIIKDIVRVDNVDVKCIRIKHPSHTFLIGKTLIPTHNSDALLMGGLQHVDVKGYAGIIFRKTYADLTKPGALIDRAKEWLFQFPEVKWNDKDKKFEFQIAYGPHKETNSILQFGYLENANDRYNYQGGEYQYIGFDELTHIAYISYKYMFSRLRRLVNTDVPLRVRSASNPPDDDSGIWVKKRFIDEGPANNRVFIPAGLNDNPYLDVEEYRKALSELDAVTRARLEDGNWEIVRKGNMFKRTYFRSIEASELPSQRKRVRWWDMAATDEEKAKNKNKSNEPDYTVGFLLSACNGIYYIEDILRARMSPDVAVSTQEATAKVDGYSTMVREEQEPGSAGITLCSIKAKTTFAGYSYEAVKSTGDKTTRAYAASAAAERGMIYYVAGCRNIEEFFNEAESFPGGIHDDMVDGLSGSFTCLCSNITSGGVIVVDKEESADNYNFDMDPGYFSRFGQ